MSGLAAAKGSFITPTDLDVQRIDGIGFRPIAVVAWWARQASSGSSSGNRGGLGFWTDMDSASVAWASGDGETSTRTSRLADSVALLGLDRAGAELAMKVVVESFDEDGLTLRYGLPHSESWVVHFLALGGESIDDAQVGWASSPPPVRSRSSHPSFVLLAPVPPESGVVTRDLSVGFGADGTQGRAAAGYYCRDRAAPGDPTGSQRSDSATLDWPQERAQRSRYCYLRVDGLHARVGVDVSPTGPGTRYTRVGFRPEVLILFSWGLSPSPVWKTMGRFCLGGVSGRESGCISWDDRDGDPHETRTHVWSSTEHALVVADSQTGELHAWATVASSDDRGFTLDWTNDGKHREFVYVALTSRDPRGRVRRVLDRLPHPARRGWRIYRHRSASFSGA
jgi:hypothetical protein